MHVALSGNPVTRPSWPPETPLPLLPKHRETEAKVIPSHQAGLCAPCQETAVPSWLLGPEREQLLKHITAASPGLLIRWVPLTRWVPLSTFQVSPGHRRGPRRSRAVGV